MITTMTASIASFGMGLTLGLLAMREANKENNKKLADSEYELNKSSNHEWINQMDNENRQHREKVDSLYTEIGDLRAELSEVKAERDVYKTFFDGWKSTQTFNSESSKVVTLFDATQNGEEIPEGLVRTPNTEQPKNGNKFTSDDGMTADERREKAYWLSIIGHDIPKIMQLANIKSVATCKKYISEGKRLVTQKYSVKRNVRNPETGQLEEKMVPDFTEVTNGERTIEVPTAQIIDGVWMRCKTFYVPEDEPEIEDVEIYDDED